MGKETKINAYKAFNEDWTCRGFQYEVGKSYKNDEEIIIFYNGFHACENPFDVWGYYDVLDSKYAGVELSGSTDKDDTKIAAAEIHIKAELTLHDFIKRGVEYIIDVCKSEEGHHDNNASTVEFAKNASNGGHASNVSTGVYAKNTSNGNFAKNVSTGDCAKNTSTGGWANNVSTGYDARTASNGDNSENVSTGNFAKNASTGYTAINTSTGNFSRNVSTGDSAENEARGKNSVISSTGRNSLAKGVEGTWVSIAEFNDRSECIGFATGKITKRNAGKWLVAKNGKLVEAVERS